MLGKQMVTLVEEAQRLTLCWQGILSFPFQKRLGFPHTSSFDCTSEDQLATPTH